MGLWALFGLIIAGILAADLVRAPLRKLLREIYDWIAARSPKLAAAIDEFLQFMSDSFGPGNNSA